MAYEMNPLSARPMRPKRQWQNEMVSVISAKIVVLFLNFFPLQGKTKSRSFLLAVFVINLVSYFFLNILRNESLYLIIVHRFGKFWNYIYNKIDYVFIFY